MLNMGLEPPLLTCSLSRCRPMLPSAVITVLPRCFKAFSQTARHAQIGEPIVRIMVENGKKEEAQQLVEIAFWRMWKQFSALSGSAWIIKQAEHRENSLKDFMEEWVIGRLGGQWRR